MASRTLLSVVIATSFLATSALLAENAPTLAQRASLLQRDTANATALRDVRRLHIAYTQLAEVGLWNEMADLFADDAEMLVGERSVRGKAAIGKWIRDELGTGTEGLAPGEVRTLLPFSPVVNLGADGRTAKVRWHELAMLGAHGKDARWAGGIYENDYAKHGDVW